VTEPCENVPYLSGSNPEGQPIRVSVVVRACLVGERVRVILDASVPEKAVGTDLSDGPPVFSDGSLLLREGWRGKSEPYQTRSKGDALAFVRGP
jgi:hypothetical protein